MISHFALVVRSSLALVSATSVDAQQLRRLVSSALLPFASAAAMGQPAPSAWQDGASPTALLRWFNRADIGMTPWSFDDVNKVGWAQAARVAAQLCDVQGVGAGHFNGHQNLSKGTYGVQCSDADVVWRDASAQEISTSGWSFSDVNQVSWAQANRAAERLCAAANQGFAGGHFNGHQVSGNYGLFCYRGAAKWFDATDAELAATGWGFATPKLDDVQWAQAMRAATGFCQAKGFEGGFMNGHQAPNKYGVVCQKGSGLAQATERLTPVPWDDVRQSKDSPQQKITDRPRVPRDYEDLWASDPVDTPPPDTEKPTPALNCQITGLWSVAQANRNPGAPPSSYVAVTWITFAVERNGGTIYGSGLHGRTRGTIENGRIEDRAISFNVRWTDGHVGRYQGNINREGRLKGDAVDLTDPSSTASWEVLRVFEC